MLLKNGIIELSNREQLSGIKYQLRNDQLTSFN